MRLSTAQNVKLVRQRDRVADAHQFLGVLSAAHADVHENLMNLRPLVIILLFAQMRRDIADDPFHRAIARMDDHALRLGDGHVHAAHFADVNEAVLVNEVHRHGDFVRMRGEHDARAAAFIQHGHAVAVGVGKGLVGKLAGIIQPDALAAGFVSDRAGRVDQRLEEIQ
jgi:hypothetical protein